MPLPCIPSSFLMYLLFPLFIFPVLYHSHCPPSIALKRLFSFSGLYNKPLLSLYHSGPPARFLLLFSPGFVVSINNYIPLTSTPLFIFNLVSLLNFVSIFIFHSPLICPFSSISLLIYLLNLLSPVPPLPFPSFNFIMPLSSTTFMMTL